MQNRGKIRKGDVLLAISFSPYSNEFLKLAGNVLESGIPVIVFSDSILSPQDFFRLSVWGSKGNRIFWFQRGRFDFFDMFLTFFGLGIGQSNGTTKKGVK